jgi:NitT/TauT family transport system permease protein
MVPLVERRSSFVIHRLFGDSMRCNPMKGAFSYTFELEMCYVSPRVLDFGPFSTSVHQRLRPPEPFLTAVRLASGDWTAPGTAGMDFGRYKRILLPSLSFLALGATWEIVALYSGWSASAFPSPRAAAAGMWDLITNGTLLKHSVASLFRVTVGFYLAVLFGLPLGMLLGWWKLGQSMFNAMIQFLRPISPLAWIPLAMLWFGIGDKPAIFLIFLSSFFPLLLSTIHAVNHINSLYFQVAANFNFNKLEVVRKIIFPAILPGVLPALRISLGIAWLVVVAAEMIAVKSGLGYLILDSRNALRMDYVMDAMIAIGLIGICLDRIIVQLNRIKFVSWGSR